MRSCYVYAVCLKLSIWFAGLKKSLSVELNFNTVNRLPNKKRVRLFACLPYIVMDRML